MACGLKLWPLNIEDVQRVNIDELSCPAYYDL